MCPPNFDIVPESNRVYESRHNEDWTLENEKENDPKSEEQNPNLDIPIIIQGYDPLPQSVAGDFHIIEGIQQIMRMQAATNISLRNGC